MNLLKFIFLLFTTTTAIQNKINAGELDHQEEPAVANQHTIMINTYTVTCLSEEARDHMLNIANQYELLQHVSYNNQNEITFLFDEPQNRTQIVLEIIELIAESGIEGLDEEVLF